LRAGVSLMVLVRGLTCDCSPKGAQHLRTIRILQADIVKKAIGHIVSVGLTTGHRALATKRLIAKALHDGRGGAPTLDPMVSPVKNW
jgi:hypothetical protein